MTASTISQDQWKNLENKIQEINENCYKHIEASQFAIEDKLMGKLDQLMTMVTGRESRIEACNASIDDKINGKFAGVLKSLNREHYVGRDGEMFISKTPILQTPFSNIFKNKNKENKKNSGRMTFSHPKVELTHFKGEEPRNWIRKCNKFFMFHQVSDNHKSDLVDMYLDSKADTWFQSFKFVKGSVSWDEFCDDLVKRFDRKWGIDEQKKFNKLVQLGSVIDYVDKFEELKSILLCKNPHLDESYFVSSFIYDLKGELKSMIRLMKPETLTDAIEIAQFQEQTVDLIVKKHDSKFRNNSGFGTKELSGSSKKT